MFVTGPSAILQPQRDSGKNVENIKLDNQRHQKLIQDFVRKVHAGNKENAIPAGSVQSSSGDYNSQATAAAKPQKKRPLINPNKNPPPKKQHTIEIVPSERVGQKRARPTEVAPVIAAKKQVVAGATNTASEKLYTPLRATPAKTRQTPPYDINVPARNNYAPKSASQQDQHHRVHRLRRSNKKRANIDKYTFEAYKKDRERAVLELRPIFQQMNAVLNETKDNKTLSALMFEQNKKWDQQHDTKNNFWTDMARALTTINESKDLDYEAIKKFRQAAAGASVTAVPDAAKEGFAKFNNLLQNYDTWRLDQRNHPLLKTESIVHNLQVFRKRMGAYRKLFRDQQYDIFYNEKMESMKQGNVIAKADGKPTISEAEMAKQAKAEADTQIKDSFDNKGDGFGYGGRGFGKYFDQMETTIKDVLKRFSDSRMDTMSIAHQSRPDLTKIKRTYEGIKYSSQNFVDMLNRNNEDAFVDNKLLSGWGGGGQQMGMMGSALAPDTGDDPEAKFKKMMGFIMDGYGYQQMADMIRQYVNTYNDYQNISLDMAKMASGRQVQEIERMTRARVNIADQRDTFRSLRDYNRSAHEAYMDSMLLEHDVISMEGDKRRMYVEKMKRMLDAATRDRLTDFESRRASLINAAMLRDAQSKVEAAEQDLANQTLQSSYNITSKQFQGAAAADVFASHLNQSFSEMEINRGHNCNQLMKKTVQSMRY